MIIIVNEMSSSISSPPSFPPSFPPSSPSSSMSSAHESSASALQFLAETVNLYNWYLRRSANPRCRMYDDSSGEGVVWRLCEKIYLRAEEDNEVSIKLKNVVSVWRLADLGDDREEEDEPLNKTHARWWSLFVHRRQREMVEFTTRFSSDSECEQMLWNDVQSTPAAPAPVLYTNLVHLECNYIRLETLSNTYTNESGGTYTVSEVLYNGTPPIASETPPSFGAEDVELEEVYLDESYLDEMLEEDEETVDQAPLLVLDKEVVCEFECPLCYEEQCSGSPGVRTTCDHSYCESCFWKMVSQKRECGMCRGCVSEIVELIVV